MTVLFCLGSSLVCTEPRMSPRSVEITALVRAVNGILRNFAVPLVAFNMEKAKKATRSLRYFR